MNVSLRHPSPPPSQATQPAGSDSPAQPVPAQQVRAGASSIPPKQPNPANSIESYEHSASVKFAISFKNGFDPAGSASGGAPAQRFTGNLADLARAIRTPNTSQLACKLLVTLAHQTQDPKLAEHARLVLAAVWDQTQAPQGPQSQVISSNPQMAYQLQLEAENKATLGIAVSAPASVKEASSSSQATSPAPTPAVTDPASEQIQRLTEKRDALDQKQQALKQGIHTARKFFFAASAVALGCLVLTALVPPAGVFVSGLVTVFGGGATAVAAKKYVDKSTERSQLKAELAIVQKQLDNLTGMRAGLPQAQS